MIILNTYYKGKYRFFQKRGGEWGMGKGAAHRLIIKENEKIIIKTINQVKL